MIVGLLVVRLLYRCYVCIHLSKWVTFFSGCSCLFVVVVSFIKLTASTVYTPSDTLPRIYPH